MADRFRLPHRPPRRGGRHYVKGIRHLARELEEAAHFVEEQVQRKMDPDRLQEVIQFSEEMVRLHKEIGELKKNVPSPMESRLTWYLDSHKFF